MLIYGARAATGQEEQQLFDARLECLLECWRTLRFTPYPSSVANLRKFIAAGSRELRAQMDALAQELATASASAAAAAEECR